jgi:hypothetical protein
LRIAADHTSELLILNTAISNAGGYSLVLNWESKTMVMSGIHGLAWLPTGEGVLREILNWCGFPHVRADWLKPGTALGDGYNCLQLTMKIRFLITIPLKLIAVRSSARIGSGVC